MKRTLLIITMVSLFLGITAVGHAETITTYGGTFAPENTGYQDFMAEHPSVKVEWPGSVFDSTSEFTGALLTGELHCDLYILNTHTFNWPLLMQKGYCLDLSSSAVLSDAVARMHPNIAKQLMHDGRLYAIPQRITFMYLQVAGDVWKEAGLNTEDVPSSFPEFLDFLERWCDRIEQSPEPGIRTYGDSDTSEADYLGWLAKILINEATLQMQYAQQPLQFDQEELIILLHRAEGISKRLFAMESNSGPYHLFEERPAEEWPRDPHGVVYLRVNHNQPKLIKASLALWGIHPNTSLPELSIELLEKNLLGYDPLRHINLFLFTDSQPLVNPRFTEESPRLLSEIERVTKALASESISLSTRHDLESELAKWKHTLQQAELDKWVMSPEQMNDYQSAAERLYFPTPTIFAGTAASENMESLLGQFGARQLSVQQFLQELDRIVRMIEMEDN